MQFEAIKEAMQYHGHMTYIYEEPGFSFLPRQVHHFDVAVDMVFLSFHGGTMCASEIGGYHSSPEIWQRCSLTVPTYFQGSLRVIEDYEDELQEGPTVRIAGSDTWKTFYDPETGWVCIGNPEPNEEDCAVEFATDSIVALHGKHVKALWLKPTFLKTWEEAQQRYPDIRVD